MTLIHAAYDDLARVAVYLDQAIQYEEQQGRHATNIHSKLRRLLKHHLVDTLLCHLQTTVELLGDSINSQIGRHIIPQLLTNQHINSTEASFRDYMVLRDFQIFLKLLDTRIGEVIIESG